jgi:glycosyltransferase involved in cell wall biosynthesis
VTVDVVLPLFQPHEGWLEEAVESVRSQSHGDWRLLLVEDGAADDETERLGRAWCEADSRIRFFRTPDRVGPGQARMFALGRGAGDAIAFLDQDDRWMPEKLEAQVRRLQDDASVQAVLTGVAHIDGAGRSLGDASGGSGSPRWDSTTVDPDRLKRVVFLRHDGIHLVSAMIRRETFEESGGFWPGLQAGEDTEFWVRFVGDGHRFVRLDDALIERRVHRNNTSRSAAWRAGHWEALGKILSEHPDLASVVGLRKRNLLCEEGMNLLMAGQSPACRRTAARMLRIAAWDYRAWALLGLSFFPSLGATIIEPRLR